VTENTSSSAALLDELLDIMVNDSENLERVAALLTGDCTWVMEPGGTEYHGLEEIRAFMGIAMSGRTHHRGRYRIEIVNAFAGQEHLCIEYTHGAKLTGAFTLGLRPRIPAGISRYCMTYHLRDGKIDQVHEYINSSSWFLSSLIPFALSYLHWLTRRKTARLRRALAA
jgi:hypothetical protein